MHDQRSGFTVIVLKVVLIDMVTVHGTACKKRKFTFCHLFLFQREIALNHPQILIEKQDLFESENSDSESGVASEAISDEMNAAMAQYMPLRGSVNFGGKVTMADVQALVDKLNALED